MTVKWSDVPEDERKRLHRNEVANRSRARADGLPVAPVSVEGLWLIQRGMCACRECNYRKPLIVGEIVIAHRKHLKAKTGSPGHVPHNVQLWNKACNDREARQEKSDSAKFDRFNLTVPATAEKRDKPKSKWPKRKMQSRKGVRR